MSLNFTILYGSVREARAGIRLARFIEKTVLQRGHAATLVDAAERRLPLLDKMYKEYEPGTAPAILQELAQLYRESDGFIVVSGEYNHGIPPALKNLLDHFLEEYFFRPSAIVCYSAGQFGGVRAAMQLRMTLAELGMSSIPSLLPVPHIGSALTPEGNPNEPRLAAITARFFDELEWYASALQHARNAGTPY
ncbi:MAG: NAD(P)H-dependent oxidoreductase [Alphaproteobacteria bacterium]|nr:NAD(P)H-dependent oxidoreductase [Alphaproteobacteria bacterium]